MYTIEDRSFSISKQFKDDLYIFHMRVSMMLSCLKIVFSSPEPKGP